MVCGADANALQTLPPLIFITTPFLHSPHFSGKETETQGDQVTYLLAHTVEKGQVERFHVISNLNL